MKSLFAKISFLIVIVLFVSSCDSTKRVSKGKFLLVKNNISVNGKISKLEEVQNLPYQKPNTKVLKYRFRLNLYNLANPNPDSSYKAKFIIDPEKYKRKAKWLSKKQVDRLGKSFYYQGFHNMLKSIGEAPIIVNESKTKKTIARFISYYSKKGFFDVKANFKIDTLKNKKSIVNYNVETGKPYFLNKIDATIETPELDSIYKKNISNSFLKPEQYNVNNLDNERLRLTNIFRNSGAYKFQQNYISYAIDTVQTNKKTNLNLLIKDRNLKEIDTLKTEHFKLYKINKVNVFVDIEASKIGALNVDSTTYKDFHLYSNGKLKYKPKAITDAIFIAKGNYYSDINNVLTTQYLNNLRSFKYPAIQYIENTNDTINNFLTANIKIDQRKKYNFKTNFDITRSNIQQFGVSANTSVSIRNIFRGAETLEIGLRANLGSSEGLANPNNTFFNIVELGTDVKLIFPRILFPLNTDRIIPKNMIPSTAFTFGYAKQTNIGLDKENFTSTFFYNWTPKKNANARFDLFNIQFVKNINKENYFNVYKSSYSVLNSKAQVYDKNPLHFDPTNNSLIIEQGVNDFIIDALNPANPLSINQSDIKSIRSVQERRTRLVRNDLIVASSFSYNQTTKNSNLDEDYYNIKTKIESAGSLLSLISKNPLDANGNELLNNFFGVDYSQYIKTEIEYIKHWDLRAQKVFAVRAFTGLAIPYGNSTSIPFSRSYFAGGANDNRAWDAYSLGPGSSAAINDFNEANFKIALNAELRFNIFNKTNGAFFIDAGNIWNFLDNVEDESSKFNGLKSLKDIAVGSGFGIRQDFNFFVVRIDFGFKTYEPSIIDNKKWFRNYNFANTTFNFNINYPF